MKQTLEKTLGEIGKGVRLVKRAELGETVAEVRALGQQAVVLVFDGPHGDNDSWHFGGLAETCAVQEFKVGIKQWGMKEVSVRPNAEVRHGGPDGSK